MDIQKWTGKYVMIYGDRRAAMFTLVSMINRYQKVDFICLENDDYAGLYLLNRKVISIDEAKALQKDSLFIISPQTYEKISTVFENVYQYEHFGKVDKIDIGSILPPVRGEQLYNIVTDSKKYRLVIYGVDETAEIINKKLELIGVKAEYFVDDNYDGDIRTFCNKQVRSVYDLLYEDIDTLMVINTCKDLQKSTEVLTGLGLEECKNFRYIQQYQWNFYRWNHWLDPQLGYNMINEGCEKYPGFLVYGNDNVQDYKIGIIGGSTADAALYPFQSWPEILYKIMNQQGYQVTIYAGGTWGYPAGTEVLKLIRDILALEPDLVIAYSGVNNLVTDDDYPFCNAYQRQFYEKVSSKNVKRPLTYGINSKKGRFTQWLSCQRIMQAACSEFGIDFIAILQPLLGAKESYSSSEKEIILNITTENDKAADYISMGKQFSCSAKKYLKKYKWLHDCSHLLDEYGDVYIDKCHVDEKGNEIIAWRIWEFIQYKINTKRGRFKLYNIKKIIYKNLVQFSKWQGERTGLYFYQWQRKLRKYRKIYQDETAYFIGSSPMVKHDELEQLKGKITFCCDDFYRSYKMSSFRPTYTVSVHNKIIEDFGNEIIKDSGSVVWFCSDEPIMLETMKYNWLHSQKEKRILEEAALQSGIYDAGASLLAALQIGCYMGISKFVFYNIEKDAKLKGLEDGMKKEDYLEIAEWLINKGGKLFHVTKTVELPYTQQISFEEGLYI